MVDANLDLAARTVLSQYGLSTVALEFLANRGGFSGAALWRVGEPNGDVCLRAWSSNEMDGQRIQHIHFLMKRARHQGLSFVPKVHRTFTGSTYLDEGRRLWDLTTWMPGRAPNPGQVNPKTAESACAALALLHRAWALVSTTTGPCPAVQRRVEAFREWEARVR